MRLFLFFAAAFSFFNLQAQNMDADSLQRQLKIVKEDTLRVYLLESISYSYLSTSPDTAMEYALAGLNLAEKIGFAKGVAICTNAIGNVYFGIGDNAKALQYFLSYLRQKEQLKEGNLAVAYFNLANVYTEQKDYQHALFYLFQALAEDKRLLDTASLTYDYHSLGNIYTRMTKPDSSLIYLDTSYSFAVQLADTNMLGAILNSFGDAYLSKNDLLKAQDYFGSSIPFATIANDVEILISNYIGLSNISRQRDNMDSAIHYAKRAWTLANESNFLKQYLQAGVLLTNLFEEVSMYDSAYYYQKLSIATRDSIFNVEEIKKVQNLKFEEEFRRQSIESAKAEYRSKIKLFAAIGVTIILVFIAFLLWRNSMQKEKANKLLQQAKEKVETTLEELRQAQAQLIHNEKMASLGELTAGIAHEIQNPLNFVNNFSEMNKELVNELAAEIEKGNISEVKTLAADIIGNEEKILHHGRRAEAIVKGMLQHSRNNVGIREPVNINSLLDEYIRLSYHGLRAKDKTFETAIKTDFDKDLGNISIVPQDIGRVFLNLLNNAFYATAARRKMETEEYKPVVFISTSGEGNKVVIRIKDNGTGIPAAVVDKIFQPFFTTKPPGQGTGLGLSISYDIITNGHNGELKVNTREGEFTEFVITLER